MSIIEDDRPIIIPYKPRRWFIPFHNSTKRYRYEVVHRRGGKTVAIANELIKKALQNTREYPPPRYSYVGPSFSQAKDTIWAYLKHYTRGIPGVKSREDDLQITLPNGAHINLYPGAEAYERMRGLYFDGCAMDEYPLLDKNAYGSVVRPCLSDYKGWLIIAGTSNGEDHFHEMKVKAEEDPDNWDVFDIKVSETDCLSREEIADMRREQGEFKFKREMMNDFSAPIEGAYFAEQMTNMEIEERICRVPWDPRYKVIVSLDLGVKDIMTWWCWQIVGREYRLIECGGVTSKGVDWIIPELLNNRPYTYHNFIFPHDVRAREKVTAKSALDYIQTMGIPYTIVERMKAEYAIHAVRVALPICVMDSVRCKTGILALKAYQPGNNGKPLHNWASHYVDGFRHGVIGMDNSIGWDGLKTEPGIFEQARGAIRRGLKGIV